MDENKSKILSEQNMNKKLNTILFLFFVSFQFTHKKILRPSSIFGAEEANLLDKV